MQRYARYTRQDPCSVYGCPAETPPPIQPRQYAPDHNGGTPSPCCLCDSQPISLAMAYIKPQPFDGLYEPLVGWKQGTLFPALNMPYCMGGR